MESLSPRNSYASCSRVWPVLVNPILLRKNPGYKKYEEEQQEIEYENNSDGPKRLVSIRISVFHSAGSYNAGTLGQFWLFFSYSAGFYSVGFHSAVFHSTGSHSAGSHSTDSHDTGSSWPSPGVQARRV
jgi:hypothetical protein